MPTRTAVRSVRTHLLAVTLTLAAACGLTATSPAAAGAAGSGLDAEEQALLAQINAYRATRGVVALRVSRPLTRAAKWMSLDMASHDYFDHLDSRGRSVERRIASFGFRGVAKGENLAAGAAEAAATFDDLKRSAAHRRNMLRATFKVIGIGRAYREGTMLGWYWTMTFGAGR